VTAISDDDFGFDEAAFAEKNVELIIFEVGAQRYAADATLVLRIDRPEESSVIRAELGALKRGARALIFRAPGHEGSLRVDAVQGVKTVDATTLRRLPAAASPQKSCAMGVWLDGDQPVLLVDLLKTLKPQN
jgi:chemotaxis signal transduction protein